MFEQPIVRADAGPDAWCDSCAAAACERRVEKDLSAEDDFGAWSGVMCLTEPTAGTDLGLLKTRAEPNADGSYSITGNKIFISAGEQDQTENIIHSCWRVCPARRRARGVGISLFVCPKVLVNADGSLGERNKFSCASIEHKMGIHALADLCDELRRGDGVAGGCAARTACRRCSMMMNTARLYVGVQGLGVAESAYQNVLAYTKERLQGRALTGAENTRRKRRYPINASDARMLYTMKSFHRGCAGAGVVGGARGGYCAPAHGCESA